MPFKSQAQEKFLFANKPAIARRFAKHSKDMKNLPKRVGSDKDAAAEKKSGKKDGDE